MTSHSTAPGSFRKPLQTRILPALLTTAALCVAAHAQQAAPSPTPATSGTDSTLLQEVVVTATRTDETAANITSAYTKLDGDELERAQIPAVKDAVNLSPGVLSNVSGAEGASTGISIRGNRQGDTLILVDGVRSTTPMMSVCTPILTDASTLNLEDVEIIRGAHSSLFGSDAIGGIVALQTKRGSGTPTTTTFFEGGSFNTFKEGIMSSGSLGPLDYSFHYAREDTSNDRPNNDLGVNSASLRLDWTVNDKLTVGATMRTQSGAYQEPGSIRLQDYDNNEPNEHIDTDATTISLYAELKATDIWTSKLTLGTYQERYDFQNPINPESAHSSVIYPSWNYTTQSFDYYGPYPQDPEYSRDLAESANWTADWQNTLQLTDCNKLVLGTTLLYETGHDDYTDTMPPYAPYHPVYYESATNVGAYAEDQWQVIDNLTLTGGLRYDHYELAGDAFTYRCGAAYLFPTTHTKLRTSYGTSFKAPSFYQRYTTAEYNGQTLDPERAHSWDAGVDQYFLKDKVSLGLTYFHSNTSDVITYMSSPTDQPYYINQNAMATHGIEAAATAKFTPRWQGRLAYTWTESDVTAAYWTDPSQTSISGMNRTPLVPRHTLSADTNYTFDLPVGKLTLGCGLQYVAQREDVDGSLSRDVGDVSAYKEVDMPDYTLLRVYGRYELNDHVAFTARVENATNKDYEQVLGYPALGRAYYGGVQITF